MIIAIAHYVNLEAATGFDHLVYGWVFFILVFLLLLYIGEVTSKKEPKPIKSTRAASSTIPTVRNTFYLMFAVTILIGPISKQIYAGAMPELTDSVDKNTAQLLPPLYHWQPHFQQFDKIEVTNLTDLDIVYKITYMSESQEKELINFQNKFYSADRWNLLTSTLTKAGDVPIQVLEVTNIAGKKRHILYTYKIGDRFSTTKFKVKLLQLKSKLSMEDFGGTAFIYLANSEKVSLQSAITAFSSYLTSQE